LSRPEAGGKTGLEQRLGEEISMIFSGYMIAEFFDLFGNKFGKLSYILSLITRSTNTDIGIVS
jgi:hypothetical protein